MDVPTSITTSAEAGRLLNDWLDAQHERAAGDYALEFILMSTVQSQLQRAHAVMRKLDFDAGPGLSIRSSRRGLIGEPQPRAAGVYVVDEPEVTQYGVTRHEDTMRQLASIVADIMVVRACAERAARCAAADREGLPRGAGRWQQESDALTAYADDLEQQLIEPISAHVLDELRAHEARKTPAPPAIRPVQLR